MPPKDEVSVTPGIDESGALRLTTEIVAAFVAANKLDPDQLPDLIRAVHNAVVALSNGAVGLPSERPKPAAPINKSVQREYIICLEDGKKLKMLKRYLRSTYNMTPDDYRRRWGLPADYPMVAPAYAARRSEFAKQIGLGKAKKA